jgi:phytol kinase
LAIAILFLLGHDHKPFYVIAMLVLTVSDTLAALAGSRYGSIAYDVEESYRTLEGSLVFFFATYLCVHIPLLLMTDISRLQSVLVALIIALLVTGFEAVAIAGSDNLFVPLGTYFILTKMVRHDLAFTLEQTAILFAIIAITVALSFVQKVFKPSGLIGMILVNYSAWSLCNVYWFAPLLLAQLLLFLIVFIFRRQVPEDITNYQVKVLFYTASVPVLFIFAANAADDYVWLYLPYLTAIVTQIALIFYYFLSLLPAGRGGGRLSGPAAVLAAAGVIAAVPILVYLAPPFLPALGLVIAGAMSGSLLFRTLVGRYGDDDRVWTMRQRIRMLCSALAAGAVFLLQPLFW